MSNKDQLDEQKFKALLDENHSWPDYYHFKFIVKAKQKQELLDLFPDAHIEEKDSAKGNYVSLTVRVLVKSSQEVIAIYKSAKTIEGIISL
jgi:putative lipoic acid-binding regulatory protein